MPELLPTPTECPQDEPVLDIALPQVFQQPRLTTLCRGKLSNLEWKVTHLYQEAARNHPVAMASNGIVPLGEEFQAIVNEFQPLLSWGAACWDYLLTIEGCRFVRRGEHERLYFRGDYRAVTDKDYSRLLHRVFRQCVLAFAQSPDHHVLSSYLRTNFWDSVVQAYRQLDQPADPRQRKLTAYSYLRCAPYQFLNRWHDELVRETVDRLPRAERYATVRYFLHFHTVQATAAALQLSGGAVVELLHRGLFSLASDARLAYCLLRQIERY
jgi:hypothetical protein